MKFGDGIRQTSALWGDLGGQSDQAGIGLKLVPRQGNETA